MSRSIQVNYNGLPCYEIVIQHDFHLLASKIKELGYLKSTKICVVTDTNVEPLYLEAIHKELGTIFDTVTSFVFPAGEEQKNLETIGQIYEKLILEHFDRKDLLVALGGGVCGDMCGFAAATYLRGIDFIQVPTTLLSQVDSSIGGKTGVDFRQYKNMVGAFYQPRLVYMNISTLKDLPKDHFYAGLGEILKHGLIKDNSYFQWMIQHRQEILNRSPEVLEEMIAVSCNIKREVVEQDPKEQGERALLNFGHTLGHAIEKLSDFKLIHGFCVSIGIAAACELSVIKGNITAEEKQRICQVLQSFHLPVTASVSSAESVLEASKHDKKMEAGKIKFILLCAPGKAYIERSVSDEELLKAIQSIEKK
ncbi:3-dehydroquinate synthase [uncultured Roseburia sp.]|uniref:3-dehydroquinate synthase n=1 Tax=Brotonthovivens ammoniilytica TaxID=2981725 RepID=A0ABT2THQ3_9FIRM|nr:3-dehydroquinate synthase [Brotonthovivens ammoniilytica]MCU6761236.1 3-dehydroquinate synthase [Brotonthovivens ammoniilytica]SCI22829.1 3-dehydroquinate synthase [uncultured Roseburia sp.]